MRYDSPIPPNLSKLALLILIQTNTMNLTRSLFLGLAASTLLLAGCTQATNTTNTEVTTDPVAEVTATVKDVPEGCPVNNSLTVKSDEAGTVEVSHEQSYFVDWGTTGANLVFANYEVDPQSIYGHTYEETDVLTVIKLDAIGEDGFTTGVYTKADEAELQVSEFNISTIDLAGAVFNEEDEVELTYVGEDYVCGEVRSEDTYGSSIQGEFIAQYQLQS